MCGETGPHAIPVNIHTYTPSEKKIKKINHL